ncbi:MAG: DUF192 domain-containing protein [Verrucomicrobia bacterium]|nr:DUF192 domain-containing protein [Verrucomicrobiota bacterium]
MKAYFHIFTSCSALLLLAACQPTAHTAEQPADPHTYFPISIGGEELKLQLAMTPAEQQKGLMFRETLPTDHGMLFLFKRPERRSFYMRNTEIPLDIGYFDADGTLREVHKLFPYDENPVPSASHAILIAVETNRGWFQRNKVTPGATIDMEALKSALERRGHAHPLLND